MSCGVLASHRLILTDASVLRERLDMRSSILESASSPHRLRRFGLLLASGVLAGGALVAGPGVAAATTGIAPVAAVFAVAAPSDQDATYLKANAQTNLAEIALGNLTLQKSANQQARDLATKTKSDHQAALAKLQAVAEKLGVTLPTAPNATQQQAAATLAATPSTEFDVAYAQVQVAGHKLSVAATNTEISSGSDASAVSYAQGYLPVAGMHLEMAKALLSDLGGTPTAVPAGNGGQATDHTSQVVPVAVTIAGALLLLGGSLFLSRRRQTGQNHSGS